MATIPGSSSIRERLGRTRRLVRDSIIEIDNKSLTHRPDLWGHHGMAREVSAILRKPLREPVDLSLFPRVRSQRSASASKTSICALAIARSSSRM